MDAERYLRDLIRKLTERLDAAPKERASRMAESLVSEANGAVDALVATSNADRTTLMRVTGEFEHLLLQRGLIKRWTAETSMSIGGIRGRAIAGGSVPRKPEPRPEPKIIAVVPLVQDVGSVGGYKVSTICLELWSESMILRYAMTRPEPQRLETGRGRWSRPIGWEAEDDLGTSYTSMGHSGHGGGTLFVNEDSIQPAPPTTARALTLIARRTIEDPADEVRRMPGREQLADEITRVIVPLPPR